MDPERHLLLQSGQWRLLLAAVSYLLVVGWRLVAGVRDVPLLHRLGQEVGDGQDQGNHCNDNDIIEVERVCILHNLL